LIIDHASWRTGAVALGTWISLGSAFDILAAKSSLYSSYSSSSSSTAQLFFFFTCATSRQQQFFFHFVFATSWQYFLHHPFCQRPTFVA
jgi:hypothetical protein